MSSGLPLFQRVRSSRRSDSADYVSQSMPTTIKPTPMSVPPRYSRLLPLGAILLTLLRPAPCPAQPAATGAVPGAVTLTDQPYTINSLGLTIRLPVGARLDSSTVGVSDAAFVLSAEDNTWILRLHSPTSRDQSLTPARVAESLIEEVRKARTGKNPLTGDRLDGVDILDRQDSLHINEVNTARFYSRTPRADGVVLITGYTVFPVAPGRFAIFQLDCIEAEFSKARSVYETILATVHIKDASAVKTDRAVGLIAGENLLKQFSDDKLLEVLPKGARFYRLYRPGGTGLEGDDGEVAYQAVEIHPGRRGELDPKKPRSRWLQSDQEQGVIVSVKARFLDGKNVIDSESIYFLTPDRAAEAWSTRMAVRRGLDVALFTETGAGAGSAIEVSVVQQGQPQINKTWQKPPEGYLSQVETHLLPILLVRTGVESSFAFYTYQTQRTDIVLRHDAFEHSDVPGQWRILTRLNEDAAQDLTLLDADGRIIRRSFAGGVVMEAVKPERLMQLWKSKGLPTD